MSPTAMAVVAFIGALTALFAATIGIAQNDIKRVLAYSTVSQIGYMVAALGVSAFVGGIFHLMTHAFFKALLFLGSGSVIMAMHHEQDMTKMGGLKKHLPWTYWTMFAGTVAIAGIPPFAGFFSKDEILWKAFSSDYGSVFLWVLGVVGAALTAFYMFRLVSLTFEGEKRYGPELHPHEAPRTMTVPLIILAFLSIVGGFVGIPQSLLGGNAIEHWLEPIFAPAHDKLSLTPHAVEITEYLLMALSVAVAAGGIYLARRVYLERTELAEAWKTKYARLYRLLFNKYYIDEVYDATIVTPTVNVSEGFLWKGIDVVVIDGIVNGSAAVVARIAEAIRRVQSGITQQYATVFVGGILLLLTWLIFK
jgi:NADH-quinone oxidoreductase subunit L